MRRIAKLAFAAALAAAAGWAVRQLAQQRNEPAPALPQADQEAGNAAARNGALGSAGPAPDGSPSREQLYLEARRLKIKGRSKMNKQELQEAVEAVRTGGVE